MFLLQARDTPAMVRKATRAWPMEPSSLFPLLPPPPTSTSLGIHYRPPGWNEAAPPSPRHPLAPSQTLSLLHCSSSDDLANWPLSQSWTSRERGRGSRAWDTGCPQSALGKDKELAKAKSHRMAFLPGAPQL